MKREQKYQDTYWFHYYNANPSNRLGGDCVIRAICTATNISWEMIYDQLCEIGRHYHYVPNDKAVYEKLLKNLGWVKCKQPRKDDGTKFTGKEFCAVVAQPNKSYVVNMGTHHIVCVKDCKVWDIWNSSLGTVGNYYVKQS